MKRNRLCCLSLALGTTLASHPASALTGEEKQLILDVLTTPGYPLPIRYGIMDAYRRQSASFKFYEEDAFGKVEAVEAKQLLRDFARKYQEAQSEKTFLTNLQATAHSGAAMVPVAGDFIKHKLNRFVFDKMMTDFDAANTALIQDAISKISERENIDFSGARTLTPDHLIASAREMGLQFTSLLDTLSPADRQAFEARLSRGLSTLYDEALFSQIVSQGQISAENAEKQVDIIRGFFEVTNTYIEQNGEQLEKLVQMQEKLAVNIDGILQSVTANGDQLQSNLEEIELVQQMLYGKLSPAEKLQVLRQKKNFLGNGDTTALEKQLAFTVDVQNFESEVNKYASGANDLLTIAQAVGFKGPELSKAADAVAKAQGVLTEGANIALSLSTGNYLGVLSSCGRLAGIFGGQGKSAAAQQHEEVMSMLGQIYENQAWMMQKLERMDQKLDHIIAAQEKVHKEILDLRVLVFDAYKDIMAKLDQVHHTAWQTLHVALEVSSSDLRECETFWQLSSLDFGTVRGQPEYERIMAVINDSAPVSTTFAKCFDGTLSNVMRNDDIDPIFRFPDVDQSPESLAIFRSAVYAPLYSVMFGDSSVSDAMIAALFTPVGAPRQVRDKLNEDFQSWGRQSFPGFGGPAANFRRLMQPANLLAPESVVRHLSSLVDFALLADLVDSHRRVKPLQQAIADAKRFPSFGRSLIERSLEIVNVAIAQQNLVAGDIALERVRLLVDKPQKTPEEVEKLNAVLGDPESLFFQNFSLYYFNFHARSNISYHLFQNAEIEAHVRSALPGITNTFERNGESWKVVVTDEVKLPLIPPYEQTFGAFKTTTDMEALLELRRRLIQRLFEFDDLEPKRGHLRGDNASVFLFNYLSGSELPFSLE